MSSLPTPPRLGIRVPIPPAPREGESPEDDELRPGLLLEGRYQIEHRLGEGGVGFVYRARQINLHRRVAIKLLQQDVMGDEELRPRFEREALTLAALSHPNIVSLTDYGAVQGRPYLVMELLEGRTLREILDEEGALEVGRALGLARQVLLALAYAHELGIVHRDLKPANLLVQALPSHEHVKVLDFGLVKLLPGSYLDRGVQLSRVGFTFGTPAYMSPEHATGAEVDGRSDLYAVGVLLFELLSGQKPFDGELQDILRAHFTAPVPKLAERNPTLAGRGDLQALVERAMAKEREERFASAAEMIAALDAVRRAPASAAPPRVPASSLTTALAGGLARAARGSWRALRETVYPLLARGMRALGRGLSATLRFIGRALRAFYVWFRPRAKRAASWLWGALRAGVARLFKRGRAPAPGLLPAEPDMAAATVIDAELVSRVVGVEPGSRAPEASVAVRQAEPAPAASRTAEASAPTNLAEPAPAASRTAEASAPTNLAEPAPAERRAAHDSLRAEPASADEGAAPAGHPSAREQAQQAARRAMAEDLTIDDDAPRSGSGPGGR